MDAGAVGEGVFAHDGLAAGDVESAHAADDAGGLQNLTRGDAGVESAVEIATGFEGHDDFFQGAVAGTFPDAVEGAFDLAGSGVIRSSDTRPR